MNLPLYSPTAPMDHSDFPRFSSQTQAAVPTRACGRSNAASECPPDPTAKNAIAGDNLISIIGGIALIRAVR
jgi:hypothetical protein